MSDSKWLVRESSLAIGALIGGAMTMAVPGDPNGAGTSKCLRPARTYAP